MKLTFLLIGLTQYVLAEKFFLVETAGNTSKRLYIYITLPENGVRSCQYSISKLDGLLVE